VSLWFNATPEAAGLQTLFARDGGGNPVFALLLSETLDLQWFVDTEAVYTTATQPIAPGTTYHLAAVYEKSRAETLTLYLNGAVLDSASGLAAFDDDAALPFYFGSFGGVFDYAGQLDDLQIYDRALSTADIEFLFEHPPSPIQPALPDVTSPADSIVIVNGDDDGDGSAGDPPAAEGVENAINDVAQKYLNFRDVRSGFIVTPAAGPTVITGARFYTANDSPERDPASYEILGSTVGPDGPFVLIDSGGLSLPLERNGSGDIPVDYRNLVHQEVSFENEVAYVSYQVVFPTLRDAAAANSMQIAEVEFLGVVVPTEPLPGDIDGDGQVQFSDFVILSNNFNQQVPPGTSGDLDGDGLVQFSDFVILSNNFGQTAEPIIPAAADAVLADLS
jgi:hypothetical protein